MKGVNQVLDVGQVNLDQGPRHVNLVHQLVQPPVKLPGARGIDAGRGLGEINCLLDESRRRQADEVVGLLGDHHRFHVRRQLAQRAAPVTLVFTIGQAA